MDYEEHEEEEEEEEEEEAEEMDQELPNLYHHHPTNPSPTPRKNTGVRYRECLKNHAVGIAGHAVDGCGEFLAAGNDGTLDALKCAACGCHRNFHRKETGGDPGAASAALYGHGPFSTYYRTPAGYVHVAAAPHLRPPPTLALPSTSGGGMAYGREEEEDVSNPSSGGGPPGLPTPTGGAARKRFRTKFTQEQKEKMLALAERLGWRLQKQDDEVVQQFCAETGVKRHVLKVWMHNNKHTLGKKP